jgi:hypothetical protein
LRAIQ